MDDTQETRVRALLGDSVDVQDIWKAIFEPSTLSLYKQFLGSVEDALHVLYNRHGAFSNRASTSRRTCVGHWV